MYIFRWICFHGIKKTNTIFLSSDQYLVSSQMQLMSIKCTFFNGVLQYQIIKGVAQKRNGMRTMDILYLININARVFFHIFICMHFMFSFIRNTTWRTNIKFSKFTLLEKNTKYTSMLYLI